MSKCSFCDVPCLNDHCEFGNLNSQNVISNGGNTMDENIEQKYIKWYEEFFTSGDCDKFLIEEAAFIAGYEVAKSEYEAKLKQAVEVIEFYAHPKASIHGVEWEEGGEYAREFLKDME